MSTYLGVIESKSKSTWAEFQTETTDSAAVRVRQVGLRIKLMRPEAPGAVRDSRYMDSRAGNIVCRNNVNVEVSDASDRPIPRRKIRGNDPDYVDQHTTSMDQ
jgi:hypothetical protein